MSTRKGNLAAGRSQAQPRQGRAQGGREADVSAIFRKLKTVPLKYNNNYNYKKITPIAPDW